MCSSPKLIAAYHVLLRLSDPRHPPYALICFKNLIDIFYVHHCTLFLLSLQLFISNMSKNFISIIQFVTANCIMKLADVKIMNLQAHGHII